MKTNVVPFESYETKTVDGIENRYVRFGNSLLMDYNFKSLSNSAKVIYMYMKIESAGNQIFEFPYKKYSSIVTKPTFSKAKDELIKKGFIEIESDRKNICKSTIYKFSENWKELKND